VYLTPAHPYTQGLIDSAPMADRESEQAKSKAGVRGELPNTLKPPSGCRFRTGCPLAQQICALVEPPLRPFSPGRHLAAGHFPGNSRSPPAAAGGVPRQRPAAPGRVSLDLAGGGRWGAGWVGVVATVW